MDKFRYLHSLSDIYEQLKIRTNYPLFHLVDQLDLVITKINGDFITVLNEEGKTNVFSLSHMYHKRVIRPDHDLFQVEYIGHHEISVKHEPNKAIHDYQHLEATLKAYDFDGFYLLVSVDDLLNTMKNGNFLATRLKKDPTIDMEEVFQEKTTKQDLLVNFKDNIEYFVRLHYRAKDDLLLATYHSFVRNKKPCVLVRLSFDILLDPSNRCYPLSNCGLDLIYDQHFYQLFLTPKTFPLYHFHKYDFPSMFGDYDNHEISTMVRTAEVLVFHQLSSKYIDQLYFENNEDKDYFIRQSTQKNQALPLEVNPTKFY